MAGHTVRERGGLGTLAEGKEEKEKDTRICHRLQKINTIDGHIIKIL